MLTVAVTTKQTIHAILWAKRHLSGELKVAELEAIRPLITVDDICIDVGAHGGAWSVPLSKLVNRGRVYAIEALPYYAEVLRRTIQILRRKNIIVLNKAVVESHRPVSIVWKDDTDKELTGLTHVAGADEETEDCITVEGITLDDLLDQTIKQKVRLVKMDIEGAELLALKGAMKLIKTFHPILYLEVWRLYCQRYGYAVGDIFDLLYNLGYRSFFISPPCQLVSIEPEKYSGKGDLLFVHSEDVSAYGI